MYLDSSGNL